MARRSTILFALVFIVLLGVIVYLIISLYVTNKRKKGEPVDSSLDDTLFWYGIVLIILVSILVIWVIADLLIGGRTLSAGADVVVSETVGTRPLQTSKPSTVPLTTSSSTTKPLRVSSAGTFADNAIREDSVERLLALTAL